MDGHQQQKRRMADFELNSDILSSLPSEIIEKIIVKLPLKEAIRTSILSSKWRSSWASIPDLVFDQNIPDQSKLIEPVDKVLQVHQGPILKFEIECVRACKVVFDRWLLILSQKGLKDLRLNFDTYKGSMVPSSLFSCDKLEKLLITSCTIYVPQCFQGLKLLRNVDLWYCKLKGITIEKFVSSCPLLESLILFGFVKSGCLTIHAPNLKRLKFQGGFANLSLETPKLISVSIFLNGGYWNFRPVNDGCKSNLLYTLGQLSNIEELMMESNFCEYLASDPIPEKLPVIFHQLKKIYIKDEGISKAVEAAF
ncbi:F-box/RNI/FBD-like domain protein [Rhynchospora pubera]|uniref:F-box/RNI/FBD-like domain protein n=1 Tax=Rhynchospora pubera TaxID=906938 RepID=A0AAV8G8Y9_9POAL|nr:F-box/RNI/FBD-like domain protein [Rhynchospora pubera]